jgi:hypothetical protein
VRFYGLWVALTIVACSSPQASRPRSDSFDVAAANPANGRQDPRDPSTSQAAQSLQASPTSPAPVSTTPNPAPTNPEPKTPSDPDAADAPDPDTTLPLGNGTDVVIEMLADSKRELPQLSIELKREKKTVRRREGWKDITGFDLKKLHPCDTWSTRLTREALGKINAVRLSLICRIGDDYFTSTEIAVLLNPDDLSTIWAGPADEWASSMDSCIQSRRVTFRGINPKTLEKTILDSTIWSEQLIEDGVKARLKAECKVGSTRVVERVVLR